MEHEVVLENSSSFTVCKLLNTIIYEGHKVFEYQTKTDLLNGPGT